MEPRIAAGSRGTDPYPCRGACNGPRDLSTDAATGTVGDGGASGGIAVSTAAFDQIDPAVASKGGSYLVAWRDNRSNSLGTSTGADIYAARVDAATGTVGDGGAMGGIVVSRGENPQYEVSLASSESGFLVAWTDYRNMASSRRDIFAVRLSETGDVLDAAGIAISTTVHEQSSPCVASNGSNYLVAWSDGRAFSLGTGTSYDIYAARVDAATGDVGDGGATGGIAVSTVVNNQFVPAVASDGGNYLVAWYDSRAFSVGTGTGYDIYAARVDATSGTVGDGGAAGGISVSTATGDQLLPAVASNGTNYLVTWLDSRGFSLGTSWDIYAARVDAATAAVGDGGSTAGIAVSTAPGEQMRPAVASAGTDYLVACLLVRVQRRVRGRRRDVHGYRRVRDQCGQLLDECVVREHEWRVRVHVRLGVQR